MKLISSNPIHELLSLNLSRQQFGYSKNLLAYGERLKIVQQRLLFLKRCKKHAIFPNFIENSINIKNPNTLFPIFTPKKMTEYIRNFKSQSLRQVITQQYLRIGGIKAKISESKRSVRDMVNQRVYSHIIDIYPTTIV